MAIENMRNLTTGRSGPVGGSGLHARWVVWVARIVSAVPVLMMLFSASMKLTRQPAVIDSFVTKFGYPEHTLVPIGVLEAACALLYAIPRTAVLGAVLVAAYLGGAVATHVRTNDPAFVAPAVLGILAWVGLYLRDERIRALLPLRRARQTGAPGA